MSTAPNHHLPEASVPAVEESRVGASASRRTSRWAGFTLIELLVVISIIGVLAGLTVGLTGLATRRSKESRIRTEMTMLINAIENYKSAMGSYPPDHQIPDPTDRSKFVGLPSPNQLFYELSGTVYKDQQQRVDPPKFFVPGQGEGLSGAQIQTLFGSSGFANAQRSEKDLKFTEAFKSSLVKPVVVGSTTINVLAVPVKGPNYWALPANNNTLVNPWLYVSTSPTNNPDRFDLWTEVIIAGKTLRFSNWEKDPVVLTP